MYSPDNSKTQPKTQRSRASAVARLVLAGLVLVNLGVFAGSRLAAWSNRGAESAAITAAAAKKTSPPRRALSTSASASSSKKSKTLAALARLSATDPGPRGVAARRELAHAEPEIWASGGENKSRRDISAEVSSLLTEQERTELRQLCGRTLYHSLQTAVRPRGGRGGDAVFVATGDIDDMWIRDSSVQLSVYFPRVSRRPALRRVLEGAIRTQAFLILQDPYANAYSADWRDATRLPKSDRIIGRGGWVATRNYELDSGAYYLNMLWNYHRSEPRMFGAERFLNDTEVFDAAMLLVRTWTVEQRHEEESPYRYSELPRGGKGPLSAFTGMSWSGYRPSDDPQKFGYNVPVNMYAAGALERALEINAEVWKSPEFAREASRLAGEIRAGIEAHGIVEVADDDDNGGATTTTTTKKKKMYAYEVDGMGNALSDFDDPNVPSLLSIPLLGYPHFDPEVYSETRKRILSRKNEWYFEGSVLSGLGSPHTPRGYVWPLAVMVDALTTDEPAARAEALRSLLRAQCGNGLMHESVHNSEGSACTREWFEWANAMFVVLYEDTLKERCDGEAERNRLAEIRGRETSGGGNSPVIPGVAANPNAGGGGGASPTDPLSDPLFYESLEAQIHFMP